MIIAFQVAPLSVEDSHLNMLPICPVNVITPLMLLPAQKAIVPAVVPPADGASSVMITEAEFAKQGAAAFIVQVN